MSSTVWALVVEDDAHQLMVLSAIFKSMGISCKRNTTGNNVREQARAMPSTPHFIILELDLMRGDPFEILGTLHEDDRTAHVPIIVLGDEKWFYQQDRLRAAHCAGYISKPIPRQAFERLIQRVLDGEDLWQERT